MGILQLNNLTKRFNDVIAVDQVNLEVNEGEFVVMVGPSGCGKSTTLRMIAGLETITEGDLFLNGRRLNQVHSSQRNMAMVFQSYALYPHMSVFENIAFGMKVRKVPKQKIKEKVLHAAKILQLEPLLDRKPKELSGGQNQRVALGRAIVREPEVFLMDEPLSNLDAKLRTHMRTEIKELQRKLKATMVYVTHDQIEAMTMGDKIVVMNQGKVQQIGSPIDLYNKPINRFVGEFIGSPPMNFIEGTLVEEENQLRLKMEEQSIFLSKDITIPLRQYIGKKLLMGMRAEDIYLADSTEAYTYQFPIINLEVLGGESLIFFQFHQKIWIAKLYGQYIYRNGESIKLKLQPSKIHLFEKESEWRLPEEFQLYR